MSQIFYLLSFTSSLQVFGDKDGRVLQEILLHKCMKYILRILYIPTHFPCIQTLLKRSDVFVRQSGP